MNPNQKASKYRRISQTTATLMVVMAVFYAVLELAVDWIPAVGQILAFFVDLFSLLHFSFWFMLCRVKLISPKVAKRFWISMLGGMLPIPVIDVFLVPLAVTLTIRSTWKDDGGKSNIIKFPKKVSNKFKRAA